MLYQLVKAIHRCDAEFEDVKIVLENIMKERTAQFIDVAKCQASVISYEVEDQKMRF